MGINRMIGRSVIGLAVLVAGYGVQPAYAQEGAGNAALDELSEAAETPQAALAMAATQEAEGDLLGAASTLERALLDNPHADDVRLAYATLLCQLDDRESARVEIAALRSRPVSGNEWKRMLGACGEDFDRISRQVGQINGYVSAGIAYDQDAFGELNALSFFSPQDRDGLAFVASSQINARLPMGDGNAFAYGDLYAQTHNDISGPDSDYQFGDAAIGFGIVRGASEFTAGGLVRHGRIAGSELFTAYGGEFGASFLAGSSGRVSFRVEAVDEDYVFDLQDGWHYTFLASYESHHLRGSSIYFAAAYETKDAQFDVFGYDAFSLAGALELPLSSNGMYGRLSSTVRRVDFHNEEFFDDRRDLRFFTRAAVGVPLIGRSLFLEGAASYRLRGHNLPFLQDYNSLGGDLRLVWRF